MDRIDNMMFTSGHPMGLWYGCDEIEVIKASVGQRLKVAHEQLNEIALEDIEIDRDSQLRIYNAFYDLALVAEISGPSLLSGAEPPGVPCTGFWIEDTEDLILYAWNDYQARTIVVPRADWFVRDDIVIH
ncbi:MAG: hypothetical protein QNI89_13455 [Desulfobacterales bacterium]|nr:hypothetical protein [Desulfobacterales bacterium]MDJ0888310.1 hypothetical protein [Desulfobacterales bacterium]